MTIETARRFATRWLPLAGGAALLLTLTIALDRPSRAGETPPEGPPAIDLSGGPAFPLSAHLESRDIAAGKIPFQQLFDDGAKLFHTRYNGLDGVGVARLPSGAKLLRFSVVPPGEGQVTAINSQSCGECHNTPFRASAGTAESNIVIDGAKAGKLPFNTRSTTSLFGDGILQRLAEEITGDLQAARDQAVRQAKAKPGVEAKKDLRSKGISYGWIGAIADAAGKVKLDLAGLQGVDPDLVVRPMGAKGDFATVRDNVIAPAASLMGMQSEEVVWKAPEGAGADPDGDGVERELSVGDITAIVVYNAAQETPQPIARLASLGMVQPPSADDQAAIERGRKTFSSIGCAGCHVPTMHLADTNFEEPTARGNGNYYDHGLAAKDPGYDPAHPARFDLLKDAQPPRLAPDPKGGATVELYGDLKRHHMGRQLADPAGPSPTFTAEFAPLMQDGQIALIPPDLFLTTELWGVGNTGPWLHDARAGTLAEAILDHGEDDPPAPGDPGRSEAQEARDAFKALSQAERRDLLVFLRSLRTFSPDE